MELQEQVPLASLTTFHTGGTARYVALCATEDDIREALTVARDHKIPFRILGEGSNILAADAGFPGVILRIRDTTLSVAEDEDAVLLTAAAGMSWDVLVREAATRSLWGIENLAGIPGSVGAAPVQNIGAYGSEVKDTIVSVRVMDPLTGTIQMIGTESCAFGYRDSRFKRTNELILSVTFRLTREGAASLTYKDLAAYAAAGGDTSTPEAIGTAVRAIRAQKFPDVTKEGTAGSFFKNPVVSREVYTTLAHTYPDLPGFETPTGIKLPLAFVLDKVLGLRGYRVGNVRLFEQQPLVLVADGTATSEEIDMFAKSIEAKVFERIGIHVEREVQLFP